MALLALVYVCSLFMIGRNSISLIFKIRRLFFEDYRKELQTSKQELFVFFALCLTAILGIVCGTSMLFPNVIFGYYLYFVVSGMMIYSYINYAGICYDEKNWIMFVVSIVVIIVIMVLATLLGYYMATGIID